MSHTHAQTGSLHSLRDQRDCQYLNTIIEEADSRDASPSRLAKRALWLSPASDRFPTPRGGHFLAAPVLPSSPSSASMDEEDDTDVASSPASNTSSSPWNSSGRASTEGTEFDELYDATDDEAYQRRQRVPSIGRKSSVSRRPAAPAHRPASPEESRRPLPRLAIPIHAPSLSPAVASPGHKPGASPLPPTPAAQVAMSPANVSFMQKHHALAVPTASAPPSLDGSLTSDQMSQMSAQASAPPTPSVADDEDAAAVAAAASTWAGVQLQPGALATLQSLSRPDAEETSPTEQRAEMVETRPQRLFTSGLAAARNTVPFSPAQQRSLAGLTRLEIPSPGGFFSGLSSHARHTWHLPGTTPDDSACPPTSGAAEQFYRLPWAEGNQARQPLPRLPDHVLSSSPVEQVIEVAAPVTSDPLTAFRVQQTPVTALLVPESAATPGSIPEPSMSATSPPSPLVATEIVDYHAVDSSRLQQLALSHLDRTEMWLVAQRAYLNGVTNLTESHDDARAPWSPRSPGAESLPAPPVPAKDGESSEEEPEAVEAMVLTRKKTVRFSEGIPSPAPRVLPGRLLHRESAYYRAFTDGIVRSQRGDAFVHQLPRFEALQAQRLLLRAAHRNQLLGKYQLTVVPQSAKKRMSANVVRGDAELVDDPAKLCADKEADARGQMALAAWHVQATRLLNGGRLVPAPVHERLLSPPPPPPRSPRTRILDLGGQATCDWAWHAALQYPSAKVYSVTTKAIRQLSNANVRGPPNHRQVAVDRLTRLPFADDQFDLVRAAELHAILKFVGENGQDEWEACLRECFRVLKPGGYLDFALLDADLLNAGPLANAKSVEFGFLLHTLGYDPAPTRLFLDRLARAGFADTRRAWLALPVGPRPPVHHPAPPTHDSSTSADLPVTLALDPFVAGSTDAVAAVAGLAASVSWERWLLRAEMEKTAGDLRLADTVTASPALHEAGKSLDGVHAIVEEGRHIGAAWRMLRGHCRKPKLDMMGTINMMLDMGAEWQL